MKYVIEGGNSLNGEIFISGAKNAVLPILAGSILNRGIVVLKNVPNLLDTKISIQILEELGCIVEILGDTVIINSKGLNKSSIKRHLVKQMRSSIIFLGSLISLNKEVTIYKPGGCKIGERSIDYHIEAFKKIGIEINLEDDKIKCSVKECQDKDITIKLPFKSVGTTQNIILASILRKGIVYIKNYAKEPEILDMINFLNVMGANITVCNSAIIIKGVKELKDFCEYTIMPDRIEAGTFLCMGMTSKSEICLRNINADILKSTINPLKKMGASINIQKNEINIKAPNSIKPIDFLQTNPYPHFPTDMQSQIIAVLTLSKGVSIIRENIFEARNKYVEELKKMGASIYEKNGIFIIKGNETITGTEVVATDLRGGASLVIAGIMAKGETIVNNIFYIQRGYEKLEYKLTSLGANIKYTKD